MRIGGKVSAAVIMLALTLAPGAGATHQEPVLPDVASNPENLILRLVDLSRGYRVGNDGYCTEGYFYEEGLDTELYQLDIQHPSYTCEIDFRSRGYTQWGRLDGVISNAAVFARLDSAVMTHDAFTSDAGGPLKRAPARRLGDESTFYVTRSRRSQPQAVMAWRTGRVVSFVSANGESKQWVMRNVLRLARVQQARIESPKALVPTDNQRRSIPIFDPDIQTPIYWLGKTFQGHGLPGRHLEYTEAGDPGYGPDWIATADYGYISLGTWTHRKWKRFKHSRAGRQVLRGGPCSTITRVPVRNGYAMLIRRRDTPPIPLKGALARLWKRCDQRWPESAYIDMAYVRYRDVVVSVNVPQCLGCVAGTLDRYDSPKGMRAIVRGLRVLRPRSSSRSDFSTSGGGEIRTRGGR